MAAADRRSPVPDLCQLLGVARDACRAQIAPAWRCRARAGHRDARHGDEAAEAGARFGALAGAWRVLGDPGRRGRLRPRPRQRPGVREDGAGPGAGAAVRPGGGPGPVPGPPLRAGPVRVDGPHAAPAGGGEEDGFRVAVLAALALRCLARDRAWDQDGAGCGEPGLGGPGPGAVPHLGGRGIGRAAPADAADLRARAAGSGPQRGRDPPVLTAGHREAGRDRRASRRSRSRTGRRICGDCGLGANASSTRSMKKGG